MKRIFFSLFSIGLIGIFLTAWQSLAIESIMIGFSNLKAPGEVPAGWKLKERKGDAEFRIVQDSGRTALYVKSVRASFSFERPLEINPTKFPYLTWQWKVLKLPEGADLRARGKNDQAAQLLILFEGKRTISYVWDSTAPEGTITDESIGWPISIKIKVIVVKSGNNDLNRWITFRRNILEDYRTLYGTDAPMIKGIRLQINTQHTGTTAEAMFGEIVFSSNTEG